MDTWRGKWQGIDPRFDPIACAPKQPRRGGKRIDWRAIIAASLLGVLGGSTIHPLLSPGEKAYLTHAGARAMEERIMAVVTHRFDLLDAKLRINFPSKQTRERIEALEEAMREVKPDYRPPTKTFNAPAP